MNRKLFHNRVAIITAATNPLGWKIAERLADLGSHLILASHDRDKLAQLEKKFVKLRTGVITLTTDMDRMESVQNLIDTTLKHFARIDFLIGNNDLIPSNGKMTADHFRMTLDKNLFQVWNCINQTLPHMIFRRSGHIVVVSSASARKGLLGESIYAATHAAIRSYSDILRRKVKKSGVLISTVTPFPLKDAGPVNSDHHFLYPESSLKSIVNGIIKAIVSRKPEVIIPRFRGSFLFLLNHLFSSWTDFIFDRTSTTDIDFSVRDTRSEFPDREEVL